MDGIRLYGMAILLIALAACKKETQPAEENDMELITTIQLDFEHDGSTQKATFIWEDADGPGGDEPYSDTIKLKAGTMYSVTVSFWNKTLNPAEDITNEVQNESEHHRIYYEPGAATGIIVDGLDDDVSGMPLGVNSVWTTTDVSAGNVLVVLRHYPEGGKRPGDEINNPASTTDAGAVFEVITN